MAYPTIHPITSRPNRNSTSRNAVEKDVFCGRIPYTGTLSCYRRIPHISSTACVCTCPRVHDEWPRRSTRVVPRSNAQLSWYGMRPSRTPKWYQPLEFDQLYPVPTDPFFGWDFGCLVRETDVRR